MNFLIVEDDLNKANSLTEFILANYANSEIKHKASYQSGIKEILRCQYDIILLDMSMPTFDITPQDSGGRPLPLAGKDILYRMNRNNIQSPVIIVTQYEDFEGVSLDELKETLFREYKLNYKGAVYYNSTRDNWKSDLKRIIDIIRSEL